MASQEALDKLRAVLDYIPEEAARRLPGDPQEYYDALTRRMSRTVAVKSMVKRRVIVAQPDLSEDVEPDAPAWQPPPPPPLPPEPEPLPPEPEPPEPEPEPEARAVAEASSVVEAIGPGDEAYADPGEDAPDAGDFFDVVKPAGRVDMEPVEPEVSLSESEWSDLERAPAPEETAEAPNVAGDEPAAAEGEEGEAFEEIVLPSAHAPELPEDVPVEDSAGAQGEPGEMGVAEPGPGPATAEFVVEESGEVTAPGEFEVLAEEEAEVAEGGEPPYQVNEFTLYRRDTRGKGGKGRTSFFFSAEPEVPNAAPAPLPEGYEVIVHEVTGIPVVRKSMARVLPVIEIEGLGPVMAERLDRAGVRTTRDLLRVDVRAVADETGISERLLRNFRAMSDLLQVQGIYPDQAAALVYAGVRGLDDLAAGAPADLAKRMNQAAKDHQLQLRGKMTASRVRSWQERVKKMRP